MLNANVQWDDIWRWGLWEIIRLWRWSPYERDSCHYRYPRELLCLYRHMRTQLGNRLAVSEAGSELSPYSELQISDFPNSRLWGISCCVYKPLSQYFFILFCFVISPNRLVYHALEIKCDSQTQCLEEWVNVGVIQKENTVKEAGFFQQGRRSVLS